MKETKRGRVTSLMRQLAVGKNKGYFALLSTARGRGSSGLSVRSEREGADREKWRGEGLRVQQKGIDTTFCEDDRRWETRTPEVELKMRVLGNTG